MPLAPLTQALFVGSSPITTTHPTGWAQSIFGAVHKEAGGIFGLWNFPRAVWKSVAQEMQSEAAADSLVKMLSVWNYRRCSAGG